MYFESLCKAFASLPQVEALALGGSRAGEQYDEKSDYDLYIYCTEVPLESVRRQILSEYCNLHTYSLLHFKYSFYFLL